MVTINFQYLQYHASVSASSASLPYVVRRTRFHSFPVYQEISCGGSRKMTLMRQVQGDIWVSWVIFVYYQDNLDIERRHP